MHPGVVPPLDHVLPAARTEASRELRGQEGLQICKAARFGGASAVHEALVVELVGLPEESERMERIGPVAAALHAAITRMRIRKTDGRHEWIRQTRPTREYKRRSEDREASRAGHAGRGSVCSWEVEPDEVWEERKC
ncbi:hypothetical protein C0992_009369 [Termitomyces sp. T32_za158]|nr:hypothetical protein C0992_009369 [Termitomyces sp. T32_za158]